MALLGSAANIVQFLGVDIFGLISMIVESEQRVRRNEEACRLLSVHASMIKDRLQLLQASKFFEHPETWKPAQGLKRTLLRVHNLILACRHSSYAYKFCMGCELADRLESVQKEMDAYNRHLSDIRLDILCDAYTVVIPRDFHGNRNIFNQDGAQVPATGLSASHSNDNDRGNLTGDSGQCQLVTEACKVTEGHLPDIAEEFTENRRSSWCCWCPNISLRGRGVRARETPLDWPKRRQIVEGIAQGAMYLHKLCEPRIIHGDLKPGNILLGNDFNPKICDFGISRTLNPGAVEDCTGIITGSRGFIAPEYIGRGCLSVKADVYSFGVTLLQVISGIRFAPPPLILSPESRVYGPLNKHGTCG